MERWGSRTFSCTQWSYFIRGLVQMKTWVLLGGGTIRRVVPAPAPQPPLPRLSLCLPYMALATDTPPLWTPGEAGPAGLSQDSLAGRHVWG